MSITKRTNTAKWLDTQKRWQINVQKDGERRSFCSSTPGRTGQREANAKADAWLDENVVDQKARVDKVYEEYLENVKLRTSQHNWRNQNERWKCWIRPVIGSRRVIDLRDSHLQSVVDNAYRKKKLAKKTLKNIRGDLTAFVKYCRKARLTAYIPEDITIPSTAKIGEKTILQPADIATLFTVDTTLDHGKRVLEPYINAFRFQVLTGLRPGELICLMATDVKDGILCVNRSIDTSNNITPGKNKNAKRPVLLTSEALEVIAAQQEFERDSIYLFGVNTQSHYRKRLKKYCIANGLPIVTPYELRHTFVSMAKTLPDGLIKSIVGHSKDMDTFGVYGHALKGDVKRSTDMLSATFQELLAAGQEERKKQKTEVG